MQLFVLPSDVTEISRYACPLVSLQYSVLDPDTLKRLHRSKKQQIEMEKLANKVILHKILFVDFGTTRKYSMNIIYYWENICEYGDFPVTKPKIRLTFIHFNILNEGPEKACQP